MRRRWAATSDIVGEETPCISRILAFDDFGERRVTWLVAKTYSSTAGSQESQPSTAVLSTLKLTFWPLLLLSASFSFRPTLSVVPAQYVRLLQCYARRRLHQKIRIRLLTTSAAFTHTRSPVVGFPA